MALSKGKFDMILKHSWLVILCVYEREDILNDYH